MHARVVLAGAGILVALGTAAQGHVGGFVYPIYEIPQHRLPDLYDGSLNDWEDLLPGASLDFLDFGSNEIVGGSHVDPNDLAFRVFLGWSDAEQRIYVGAERYDDIYINTYDGGGLREVWRHDGLEIMIDGDHSGGQYASFSGKVYGEEELKHLLNAQAQRYYILAESPEDRLIWSDNMFQEWPMSPPWTDVGGSEKGEAPSLTTIELAVTPWDDLHWKGPEYSTPSRLLAGTYIGFQIAIADFDTEPGEYSGWFTIAAEAPVFFDAATFVDGLLLPYADGAWHEPASVSAVRPDSWGRMKASFR